MQTGNDVGTWGSLLNADALSVIDNNLGGNLTLSVAGGIDVTLSAAQAENLYYNLTGALTGNINVIWPTGAGFYIITNNTTGAHTLTVKPSGGTGFAVTQGTTVLAFISTNTTTAFAVTQGSVNSGTINQLAYYASAGNALSGLTTANSGILVTDGSGVPSIGTALPNGVTATTQAAADSTTKVATTGFVNGTALTLASGTTAVTQTAADSTTKVATTAFVNNTALTLAAGTTAVTQSSLDSSTKVATTSYVRSQSGLATAWVRFDGTVSSPIIASSYNVSSVTKQSTGTYTVTFTSAFSDTNYLIVGSADVTSGLVPVVCADHLNYSSPLSTTAAQIAVYDSKTEANIDRVYTSVTFFGV